MNSGGQICFTFNNLITEYTSQLVGLVIDIMTYNHTNKLLRQTETWNTLLWGTVESISL